MSRITFTRQLGALLLTSFLFCLFMPMPGLAQAASQEEVSIRLFIEKYFAAYEKKDLNELLGQWNEKSPDLASNKKTLQDLFAVAQKLEIKALTIHKIFPETDKTRVRLSVEITAIDAKNEKPMEGFGKMNLTFYLVKESEGWKIWQNLSSEEELAATLVEAKTEVECKQLLEANKELITTKLVQALMAQGRRLYEQSSYSQMLTIYRVGEEIANQLGDKNALVALLRGIGNVYYMQSSYLQAQDSYDKSLKIAEEINDQSGIGKALNNLGNVHQDQGNYTQALNFYQRSLKIAEEIGNRTGAGAALHNLGNIYFSEGNYIRALDSYYKSLKIKEDVGNKFFLSSTLNGIGNIFSNQGNYTQALAYYDKSLKNAEEAGDPSSTLIALTGIGNIYSIQGDYIQALEYYQKSLKIAEEIGDKAGAIGALNNIGIAYRDQNNYLQALDYHQKSLKLAMEIGNKELISMSLNLIGIIQKLQGNYGQAIEFANRGMDFAQQVGVAYSIGDSHLLAGQSYQALHQLEQAKKAFTDVIAILEEMRNQFAGNEQQQQQFFAGKLSAYYGMISLLIEQNNIPDALSFAERAKARTLLDVLQKGKLNITTAMSLAEKQKEQKLNSEIVSLNTQIYKEKLLKQQDLHRLDDLNAQLQKARLEMEAFQTALYASHPKLQVQRGQAQTITLAQTASLIPDSKTALLEFVVSEDQTYLFVLTQSASQSVPDLKVYKIAIKQKELAKLCSDFRQRLADRRISYQDPATKLYDLLLKPAYSQLADKTNLIIIPDGVLWELPFQTLQPTRNHFLIEDTAISYAPSLTVLQKMHQTRQNYRATAKTTLLAVGNPIIGTETSAQVKRAFMGEQLLPLPEAERQVKFLQKLYTPSHSKVYIRQHADEAKLKAEAGNSRILQLATHGILNDVNPMYSQIVLAHNDADTREDGLLEAREIMNLDLNADLVVLSACETARGKVGAGEGMIGLAWAFFVAGSPATVVSQWKVESASTTELMVAFHKNLQTPPGKQNPKMTKAEAMRQAALKLMKTQEYKHPFYWAAFVVIGDAS